MRNLHKIYHEQSDSQFNNYYEKRFSYESTCVLNLQIKPIYQPKSYQLYYVPTNDIISKISKAYKISNYLENFFENLPKIAKNQFVYECIVEELFNTNELEGVKSSKEEIARSVKDIKLNKKTKVRFNSMIKSYFKIIYEDIKLPSKPDDIRLIYDEITKGEIEENELPDGAIFRKAPTYVLKKSGTGKVIHQGVTPENKIVEDINGLIALLNTEDKIPDLIRVAIGHYYFGYIHPFYDGNGRTSRFISSVYLSKYLGQVSAFSLSRGCNKYRNKYLEAFEVTNSLKGRGELNYFIDIFLDIIIKTLEEMAAELKEKAELLNLAYTKIYSEELLTNMSDSYRDVMFILAQKLFFDNSRGMTIKELSREMECTDATTRKKVKELMDLALIDQFGTKPAYFEIKEGYFEE